MDYAIIGGDARMNCLAEQLRRAGYDARHVTAGEGLGEALRDARHVVANCPPKLHGAKLSLEALLEMAPSDAAVCLCGPRSPEIPTEDERIVDLWKDERLLVENAWLTAEGALSAAMRAGRRSLRNLPCLVIGWGRIGSALTELLVAMGARVTVASRSEAHRHRAIERGAEAVAPDEVTGALSGTALVFSTPPAMVLDAEKLAAVNPEAMIIDLASPPYGVDLHAAWALGLRAWREPGIPGRRYPESAAQVLMNALLRHEGGVI